MTFDLDESKVMLTEPPSRIDHRVLLADALAEIEAAQTELNAWKTAFGTSQLTHALAAIERLRAELAAKDELLDEILDDL